MNDATIIEFAGRGTVSDPLTDLLRKGARELLQTAVEAELNAFLAEFAKYRTPEGRAAVVRNGHHPERAVQTGIGPVTVQTPKVRSKTGAPVTFPSAPRRPDRRLTGYHRPANGAVTHSHTAGIPCGVPAHSRVWTVPQ